MFKVGDIVEPIYPKGIFPLGQWEITHMERDHVKIVSITSGMELSIRRNINTGEINWELSKSYYRRKKLEKICSNLAI